jgi:hypothetical protein
LICEDCPVCAGVGSLSLGAAALAQAEPAAVARAVELFLEARATAAHHHPVTDRATLIEAAVRDLQIAGLLGTTTDTATTRRREGAVANSVAEQSAYQLARRLGVVITPRVCNGLAPANVIELRDARRKGDPWPRASANGHRSRLSLICDPIDPLGEDVKVLHLRRVAHDHLATVLATAAPVAARNPKNPRRALAMTA